MVNWGKAISGLVDNLKGDHNDNNNQDQQQQQQSYSQDQQQQQQPQAQYQSGSSDRPGYGNTYGSQPSSDQGQQYAQGQSQPQGQAQYGYAQGQDAGPGGPDLKFKIENNIYRYRKQYGLNLGSWFVVERWIVPSVFEGVNGSSEMDIVSQLPDARARLEKHWQTWILDDDWDRIRDHGLNTVRIPIGYYHLAGLDRSLLDGTDFAPYADVYTHAWDGIRWAIDEAGKRGIGVLLDLHAAPGAQNDWDHSGLPKNHCHFWEGNNQEMHMRVLSALAVQVHHVPNVVGISLMNEPKNNNQLQGFYEQAIERIRNALPPGSDFPLYIDDAWDPNWYSQWVGKRDDFVVMDQHTYRCFTPQDSEKSGEQHADGIRNQYSKDLDKWSKNAKGQIIVGEYSAALSPKSSGAERGADGGEQDRQRRVFVTAEREVFISKLAGQFFWTYKKEQGWDAGWDLRNAMKAAIVPGWLGGKRRPGELHELVDDIREEALGVALDAHKRYWQQHGSQNNEFWRFEDGFRVGWSDAWVYVNAVPETSSVSEFGYKERWIKHRTEQHVAEKGSSGNVWEFHDGFVQGFDTAWGKLVQ